MSVQDIPWKQMGVHDLFLDVQSSTPAESSRRAPCIHARLRRLATKPGEKCGLIVALQNKGGPVIGRLPGACPLHVKLGSTQGCGRLQAAPQHVAV